MDREVTADTDRVSEWARREAGRTKKCAYLGQDTGQDSCGAVRQSNRIMMVVVLVGMTGQRMKNYRRYIFKDWRKGKTCLISNHEELK